MPPVTAAIRSGEVGPARGESRGGSGEGVGGGATRGKRQHGSGPGHGRGVCAELTSFRSSIASPIATTAAWACSAFSISAVQAGGVILRCVPPVDRCEPRTRWHWGHRPVPNRGGPGWGSGWRPGREGRENGWGAGEAYVRDGWDRRAPVCAGRGAASGDSRASRPPSLRATRGAPPPERRRSRAPRAGPPPAPGRRSCGSCRPSRRAPARSRGRSSGRSWGEIKEENTGEEHGGDQGGGGAWGDHGEIVGRSCGSCRPSHRCTCSNASRDR